MRDTQIGTGGLAYLFIVAIITFSTLASAPMALIFGILLVSELSAKIGLITCCTFSRPYPNGTGRYFIEAMNWKMLSLSLIIILIIGYALLNLAGILGIVGGLLGGASMALIASRKFEYATGDILGASNEISRMLSLIFMAIFLNFI
jgi:adenosylcobinamide-GDP ribazoletransferase